jgi:hypothetical protein
VRYEGGDRMDEMVAAIMSFLAGLSQEEGKRDEA